MARGRAEGADRGGGHGAAWAACVFMVLIPEVARFCPARLAPADMVLALHVLLARVAQAPVREGDRYLLDGGAAQIAARRWLAIAPACTRALRVRASPDLPRAIRDGDHLLPAIAFPADHVLTIREPKAHRDARICFALTAGSGYCSEHVAKPVEDEHLDGNVGVGPSTDDTNRGTLPRSEANEARSRPRRSSHAGPSSACARASPRPSSGS
jgi:hypothetical protein